MVIKLKSHGDPDSQLEQARLMRWLRETSEHGNRGTVFVPEWMVKKYPVVERAMKEFDWLKPEPPRE